VGLLQCISIPHIQGELAAQSVVLRVCQEVVPTEQDKEPLEICAVVDEWHFLPKFRASGTGRFLVSNEDMQLRPRLQQHLQHLW